MNKFEHFKEHNRLINQKKEFKCETTGETRIIAVVGDLNSSCNVVFYNDVALKLIVKILNLALDAHLVQRVIDEPEEEENIEDKYTLKRLPDGKLWMMENLREKVEGAVWNEQYNCYMYTWDQAMKAVPEGFHLPSAQEFMQLALSLGYLKDDEKEVVKRLEEECGFVKSGKDAADDGMSTYNDYYGYYWSSTQYDANYAYYLYYTSSSVFPSYNNGKYGRFAIRYIKDE